MLIYELEMTFKVFSGNNIAKYMSRKSGFKLTKEHKRSISAGMKRAWEKSVGGTGAASLEKYGFLIKDRKQIRKEVIKMLGGKCKRCNFSDIRALQIDHVNGNGSKEVKSFYGGNKTMQRYIFTGRLPKENYQILCANCNWIKRHENKEFTQPK
ncbi:hypothetical protein A3D60_03415 [Candidatus Uhrbacteria bacterium RIFCSPHIGHO2_02_FULL_47_29]|uniref:HNH nuclease domain-containing protein n=1 Tax=Candidatus Uhrbacteria bacterium RIFCSPLOWO2_01_FULL_47_25 TaxID=1802402 RepID=A0A1F7UYJ6_9BACT|nr:MAG: hypothetical protein A3D60_03415 [Candidatus Uhrbacteria bacterium RIFCSPHIGHO2_02_FULL_47_29]OGL82844.1 MAG: hypothetical protein A2936_04235 [Candidatus Uhrbacteria bacterium RIFCSPLOWO2_01_FULL_47_25]OGL84014.1 MAG: hypothetical protein A3I37_04740 [Candidatus Uhrbacteria bacterium RIFCSPLOWO2_02_FULL_46_19]